MKNLPLPNSCPLGRLADFRSRPDADHIAYTLPVSIFGDCRLKRYASRAAMERFCKGSHHALVKERVESCMLVNRNFQTDK